jgi:hypothetical protein
VYVRLYRALRSDVHTEVGLFGPVAMQRGAIANGVCLPRIKVIGARHEVEFPVELPLTEEEAWKLQIESPQIR